MMVQAEATRPSLERHGVSTWRRARVAWEPWLLLTTFVASDLFPGGEGISAAEIGILGSITLLATSHFLRMVRRPRMSRVEWSFWVLTLVAIGGVGIGLANGVSAIWALRRLAPFVALSVAVSTSATLGENPRTDAMRLYWLLVGVSVLTVLRNVAPMVLEGPRVVSGYQEIRVFGNNLLAGNLSLLVFPLLIRRPSPLLLFLFALGLAVLSVGLTRSYWIATAAGFVLELAFLVRYGRFHSSLFRTLAAVIIVTIVTTAAVWNQVPVARDAVLWRLGTLRAPMQDVSVTDRLSGIQGIWATLSKEPLSYITGLGIGATYRYWSTNPFNTCGVGWTHKEYSHNWYLYLWFHVGLVGLGIFLFAVGTAMEAALRVIHRGTWREPLVLGVLGVLMGILVVNLTAPPLYSYKGALYYGAILGLASVLIRSEKTTNTPRRA